MKKIVFFLFVIAFPVLANPKNYIGCWIGKIDILQQTLAIKVCFEVDTANKLAGKIDIPQQNAYGLNLANINFSKDSIYFDLIANVMNVAKFSGKIYNPQTEKAKISGTFRQMGMVGTFELEPFVEEKDDTSQSFSFFEEEVTIQNAKGQLAGTFSRPPEIKKYPTIIFISGSGKQDRDETIFGFKIFKLISDHLVQKGYATFRIDDRGVGNSTEIPDISETIFDYASDIDSAISYLKTRDDVDSSTIGLLGHSEGGMVAFVVASRRNDVAFVISLAGPTIRGDSLILEQIRIQMQSQNTPDSLIQQTLQEQREIYKILRSNEDYEKIREIILKQAKKQLEYYPKEISSQISNTLIERNVQLQVESARSNWFRTFIDIDPLNYIQKVKCPVLLLFGELDKQVPAKINTERLKSLKNKKNISLKIIPQANHLFQKAKTGQLYEYGILPKRLAYGFLETMTSWLNQNIKTKP